MADGSGVQVIDIADPANPRVLGYYYDDYGSGEARDVAVSSNYAYVAGGWRGLGGLLVIDISNPATPWRVGDCPTSDWQLEGMALSGNYAYLADGPAGLQVINISSPASPQRVCAVTNLWARDVWVSGRYGYVAGESYGLHVIDISDPANPQQVGAVTDLRATDMSVSGRYAYVADEWYGLHIMDISSPASPQRVGAVTNLRATAVSVAGSYAYVVAGDLQVIDISDPANPHRVAGCLSSNYEVRDVAVSGRYAYVAGSGDAGGGYFDGLHVIDISDPTNPHWIGGCDTGVWSTGVVVSGNRAFVYGDLGGVVVDITDPAHPKQVGRYLARGTREGAAVSGDYLYLASSNIGQAAPGEGLVVFDISVLANPQRVSRYDFGTWWLPSGPVPITYEPDPNEVWLVNDVSNPAHPTRIGGFKTIASLFGVAVSGNYAYVADWRSGLRVFDIHDPSAPLEVSRSNTNWSVNGVAVSGHYTYLVGAWHEGTNWLYGLGVVDVSNPADPQQVGGAPGPTSALALSGQHAYLVGTTRHDGSEWIAGLQIIDISDPANPTPSGIYETNESESGEFRGVTVSGNHAYVAARDRLLVIDVSDPARPRPVGAYAGYFEAVVVSGNYAYLAHSRSGLHVLDIRDPANPQRVGGNSLCTGRALAVAGNMLYAAGDDGLVILNTYQPPPRIESTVFDADGFRLVFRGEAGRTIWLQRSPDLRTWEDWVILTATGDSQAVADPSAGSHPCQFYRAVGE